MRIGRAWLIQKAAGEHGPLMGAYHRRLKRPLALLSR